jgi:hypothetical protein
VSFEAEVQRGIALLDEQVPDWRARVSAGRLDMREPSFEWATPGTCGCLLAQLDVPTQSGFAGWYEVEAWRLMDASGAGLADNEYAYIHTWAVAHGFTIEFAACTVSEGRQRFADLTAAWKRALTGGAP